MAAGRSIRVLVTCTVLGACASITDPALPEGAVAFVAPSVYQQWWELTESCSGISGDLGAVRWYVVPDASVIRTNGGRFSTGAWYSRGNTIVLAGEAQFMGDLVRHEMLHALLRHRGHPRDAFIGQCRGVVVCTQDCIAEAGPTPPSDPAASFAAPPDLTVRVAVTPEFPSSTVNDGHFMMIVTAANTAPTPVIVQLPPSGDDGPSVSFSYRLDGGIVSQSYDMRAEVPEDMRFAAGEVKRLIFDFRVRSGPYRYDAPAGTYRFDGAYGHEWAPDPPTVTVGP